VSSGYDEDEDEDGDNDKNDNLVLPYWNEGKDHAFVHQFEDALSFCECVGRSTKKLQGYSMETTCL
jgi:hypothetical protein